MGKLVWAAIGFSAAALGAEYFLPVTGLPYLAAALALISPAALLLRKRYRRPVMTLMLAAAAGLGWWWGYYELRVAPCEALAGQDIRVTARVTEYPQVSEDYTRVTVRITGGAPRERAYLYYYGSDMPALRPGDEIAAEIRTRSVMEQGTGRLHTSTSAGIHLRGYFREEIQITGRAKTAWVYFPQEISRFVKETCETLFPGRLGVFMKALLTGDKNELYDDVEMYGDMRASGVLHAVAVSGMHVFILIQFVQILFGRGRRSVLISLPLMAVFVLMSGAGPSVIRAAVMQTLYMAAPIFRRESDSPSAIAAALLLLLLANPMSVGGVGLQLSFACVLGFAVFLPGLYEVTRRSRLMRYRLGRIGLQSLASTFSATAFSIPVGAHYFGAVALLSPLANLLAIPVIELLFAGGYVLCALYAVFPALARLGAWVLGWGVRWCLLVFRVLGRLPFACLYTADKGAVAWLVFAYGLLIAWLVLRRRGVRVLPAIPVSLGLIGLCLVFLGQGLVLRLGRREITVLDVGQGECVLCFDGDSAVVIDCGGSGLMSAGDTAADYLLAAGVRRVDALVLTHLHDDHTNGVETLLYRLPVARLILPADADDEDAVREDLLRAAETWGTEVIALAEPETARVGDLSLSMLLPQAGSNENERGIVVLASYPGAAALVMGDGGTSAELALLESGFGEDVDILVAGHHGAKTASGALFLRAVRPETAVISVGYNSYGHPAEETLDRLGTYCENVYRTDADGTVTVSMREKDE